MSQNVPFITVKPLISQNLPFDDLCPKNLHRSLSGLPGAPKGRPLDAPMSSRATRGTPWAPKAPPQTSPETPRGTQVEQAKIVVFLQENVQVRPREEKFNVCNALFALLIFLRHRLRSHLVLESVFPTTYVPVSPP